MFKQCNFFKKEYKAHYDQTIREYKKAIESQLGGSYGKSNSSRIISVSYAQKFIASQHPYEVGTYWYYNNGDVTVSYHGEKAKYSGSLKITDGLGVDDHDFPVSLGNFFGMRFSDWFARTLAQHLAYPRDEAATRCANIPVEGELDCFEE